MFRAFKQALEYAAAMNVIDTNPTGPDPQPARRGRPSPDPPVRFLRAGRDDLRRTRPALSGDPIVLVGTGLRPEELFGLDRRDLDLDAGVLTVEPVFSQGVLKDCKKSSRQRRRVPLRGRVVVDAITGMPPRIDTPVLFPAPRAGGST